jgi:hypothetical protein
MDVGQCSGLSASHERRADQKRKNVADRADVLELRMNSGWIGEKGGRGSENDCEICIRVVVALEVEGAVGRCHDLTDLDCERLTRGRNEADTPLWENQQL